MREPGAFWGAERSQQWSDLSTIGEAVDFVLSLFENQIREALEQKAEANTPIRGDSDAKSSFLTLLPLTEQRHLFLSLCRRAAFLPRIRSLVGAPPFAFLSPNDDGILNASGISYCRSNLFSENSIPNNSQIGNGHFMDEVGRRYRIVMREAGTTMASAASDPSPFSHREGRKSLFLPWKGLGPGTRLIADVKTSIMKKKKKILSVKGQLGRAAQEGSSLPRPRDRVVLFLSPKLSTREQRDGDDDDDGIGSFDSVGSQRRGVECRVEQVVQRASMSPVARIGLVVIT